MNLHLPRIFNHETFLKKLDDVLEGTIFLKIVEDNIKYYVWFLGTLTVVTFISVILLGVSK